LNSTEQVTSENVYDSRTQQWHSHQWVQRWNYHLEVVHTVSGCMARFAILYHCCIQIRKIIIMSVTFDKDCFIPSDIYSIPAIFFTSCHSTYIALLMQLTFECPGSEYCLGLNSLWHRGSVQLWFTCNFSECLLHINYQKYFLTIRKIMFSTVSEYTSVTAWNYEQFVWKKVDVWILSQPEAVKFFNLDLVLLVLDVIVGNVIFSS
jgi:hypothetical protein